MKAALRVSIVTLLLASLVSCGGDGPANGVVTISEPDAFSTVHLGPGDRLDVTLDGNPATGYNWTTLAIDEGILRPIGEPIYAFEGNLVGSGGPITLQYECVAPGETELRLGYLRAWEDALPLATYSVTVVVE